MAQIPPPPPSRLHWTGGAIALVVIGLLILIPSGLCTTAFGIIPYVSDGSSNGLGSLLIVLLFGGPFIALGIGFIVTGFRSRERK